MELKLYTVKEASSILKCSTASIYELVRKEKIKPITKIGKKILIPSLSMESFILDKPIEYLINIKSDN